MPTKAHRAIAQLVKDGIMRVIITTNFDRLLENAIRNRRRATVIKSEACPRRPLLVKLHDDYLDTRIRNTESELAGYSPSTDLNIPKIKSHGSQTRKLGEYQRGDRSNYPIGLASIGSDCCFGYV